MKYLTGLLLLACLWLSAAQGQPNGHWKKIWQIPPTPAGEKRIAESLYFFSPTHGILTTGMATNIHYVIPRTSIYYTENGLDWIEATYPRDSTALMRKVLMIDDKRGYAISGTANTAVPLDDQGVWETTDGGHSWHVYARGFASGAFFFDRSGALHHGGSPSDTKNPPVLAFARVSENLVIGVEGAWQCYRSTDDGFSWIPFVMRRADGTQFTPPEINGTAGVAFNARHHSLIVASEIQRTPYTAAYSLDSGTSWSLSAPFLSSSGISIAPTGDVRSAGKAVYVQSAMVNMELSSPFWSEAQGIFRSTDGGRNWINVGGPSNYIVTKFFAWGCQGGYVVASDSVGGIWLTTDGGDGTIIELPSQPRLLASSGVLSTTLCADTSLTIPFFNDFCDPFRLDSIAFLDDDLDLVGKGVIVFKTPTLPHEYAVDAWDSLYVGFHPGLYFDHDTSFTRRIWLRYWSGTDQGERDTTIPLRFTVRRGSASHTLSSRDLIFPSTSICGAADTTIRLVNRGCYAMRVDSLTLTGSGFALADTLYGVEIPPDSFITVRVRFIPSKPNVYGSTLTFYLYEQGSRTSERAAFSGRGLAGSAELLTSSVTSSLRFSDRSTCGVRDTLHVRISNGGCDSLRIVSIGEEEQGSPVLQFGSLVPSVLIGSDTGRLTWYLDPGEKGNFTSRVRVRYLLPDGTEHDTVFSVSATIAGGTKSLAFAEGTIDFGSGSLCRAFDTTIIYRNTGCDTLTISAALAGSGYILTQSAKTRLAPDESDTIRVHYTPSAEGPENGTLTLVSDADQNPNRTIAFTAMNIGPAHFTLRPELSDPELPSGGETVLNIYPDQSISGRGLNRIEFDLLYDTDLLTGVGYTDISGTVYTDISGGKHVTITGSDVILDAAKPVVSLVLRTSLTTSTMTPISIANLTLNGGGVSYERCILSASADSSRFTLALNCGDKTIQEKLRGKLPFRILSIRPNPAKDHIMIDVEQNEKGSLRYELISLTGTTLQSGRLTNSLSTAALPAGEYYLRISSSSNGGGFTQTEKVVVGR